MQRTISQIAHVELLSPRPEDSVQFFTDLLGMTEVKRTGQSVYLRTWGEHFHHTLVVTEGEEPGIAHTGWRAVGSDELAETVARLEGSGHGEGWLEESIGHGRAYRYRTPGGHLNEIFWEAERYRAPEAAASTYPTRPQRRAGAPAAVRQLDHVTLGTPKMLEDIAFLRGVLGYRFMEYTVLGPDDEVPFFAQLTTMEQSHDVGLLIDDHPGGGRSHHIAFWLDQALDVHRAAEHLIENGVAIESGPGRHGHGENTFLYVREPGGHRIELFSGGYRNYVPDWEPVRWIAAQGGADMFRNTTAPESMREFFPPGQLAGQGVSGSEHSWAHVS